MDPLESVARRILADNEQARAQHTARTEALLEALNNHDANFGPILDGIIEALARSVENSQEETEPTGGRSEPDG